MRKLLIQSLGLVILLIIGVVGLWHNSISLAIVCFPWSILLAVHMWADSVKASAPIPEAAPPDSNHSIDFSASGIFTYVADGFIVDSTEGPISVKWADIKALFGYKKDLYTIDCIYLDVHYALNRLLRLNEEMPGWHKFQYQLADQFPGFDWSWQVDIATPAFATNLTVLYEHQGLPLEVAQSQYYSS